MSKITDFATFDAQTEIDVRNLDWELIEQAGDCRFDPSCRDAIVAAFTKYCIEKERERIAPTFTHANDKIIDVRNSIEKLLDKMDRFERDPESWNREQRRSKEQRADPGFSTEIETEWHASRIATRAAHQGLRAVSKDQYPPFKMPRIHSAADARSFESFLYQQLLIYKRALELAEIDLRKHGDTPSRTPNLPFHGLLRRLGELYELSGGVFTSGKKKDNWSLFVRCAHKILQYASIELRPASIDVVGSTVANVRRYDKNRRGNEER